MIVAKAKADVKHLHGTLIKCSDLLSDTPRKRYAFHSLCAVDWKYRNGKLRALHKSPQRSRWRQIFRRNESREIDLIDARAVSGIFQASTPDSTFLAFLLIDSHC